MTKHKLNKMRSAAYRTDRLTQVGMLVDPENLALEEKHDKIIFLTSRRRKPGICISLNFGDRVCLGPVPCRFQGLSEHALIGFRQCGKPRGIRCPPDGG